MENPEQKNILKQKIAMIKTKAENMKKEIRALYLAYKRPDVPWYAKALAIVVVGYALSPIDLIPDFIPIIGYLDDFLLIPLGVWLVVKLIPENVMTECRAQAEIDLKGKKSKNWVAGAIIILIWVIIITIIVLKFV